MIFEEHLGNIAYIKVSKNHMKYFYAQPYPSMHKYIFYFKTYFTFQLYVKEIR